MRKQKEPLASLKVLARELSGESAKITTGDELLKKNSAVTKPVVGVFDLASNVSEGASADHGVWWHF